MKSARRITLTNEERTTLERWSRGRRTPARLVLRGKIVLRAAQGMMNREIAQKLKTAPKTVSLWRTRFAEGRLAGIEKDAPRGGRRAKTRDEIAPRIIKRPEKPRPMRCTSIPRSNRG